MCMLRKTGQGTCILGKGILIMIDFDEEVAKFRPSMEIEKVEDTVSDDKLRDISDVLISMSRSLNAHNEAGRMRDTQINYRN